METTYEIINSPQKAAPTITADQRPYLYDDLLLHILDFASKGVVATLMQTCRMFHERGTNYLLQDGVFLATNKQILSFMLFIVGNSGDDLRPRILRLRQLTLSRQRPLDDTTDSDPGPSSEETGIFLHGFFKAIASFGCLIRLTLYDSEELLGLHPELPEAIAGLRTIIQLSVSFAGARTVRMLKALRSTLFYADISIESEARDNESELLFDDQNPMFLLHGSQHTLRQLSTTFSTSAPDSPVFPRVTALNLSYTDIPRTQHYVHAFPALRMLTTDDCCGWGDGDDYDARRARNQREQDRMGAWPALQSFRGTVICLYLLGLRCPVRALELDHEEETLDPTMLHAVLGDARPQRLQLRVDGGEWLVDPDFLETFAQPGVQGLKRFELFVNLQPEDRDMDVSAALAPVVLASRIIAPLKNLVEFRFCLDCSSIKRIAYGAVPADENPLEPVEEALERWDVDEFAHRMQRELSVSAKLQSITVSIQGHRTRSPETVTVGETLSLDDGPSDDEDNSE